MESRLHGNCFYVNYILKMIKRTAGSGSAQRFFKGNRRAILTPCYASEVL